MADMTAMYGDGGTASVNSVGMPVNPAPLSVTLDEVAFGATAATTGGISSFRTNNSTMTTMMMVVKPTAGRLYGWECYSTSLATAYNMRLYDSATTPDGTGTVKISTYLPYLSGISWRSDPASRNFGPGINFNTGIALRVTGGFADGDTTSCQTGQVIVQLFYK